MTEYSKFNFVYRLQRWMDSVPGQTFLNYAYSWGASIVIAGTLFKLTHLPGANFMLFLGMGTEVVVFFLSAFDRPFDKTAEGRELPTHLTEDIIDGDSTEDNGIIVEDTPAARPAATAAPMGGGTIIIGGGGGASAQPAAATAAPQEGASAPAAATGFAPAGVTVPPTVWMSQQQENTPEMAEAQSNYVDALNSLTDMLSKVSAQSERLTRDSEEMENLNRTLTGITKIYEMQLKAASQQVGTIDQINDQTRKMASLIEQLNSIYGRMIEAMTVNMRVAAPGAVPQNNV
jgi:hypothetical protein